MWKKDFQNKIKRYMEKTIFLQQLPMFLSWWEKFGPRILNEFEWLLDEERDKAAMKELFDLKGIILRDANIDNDDPNVQRINHHIKVLFEELDQEVDYENPSREDLEAEEETS